MTLDDIRQRCVLRDGHWLFRGALSTGKWPRIWGPDLSRGGELHAQVGRRLVWQLLTGKAIPEGHRVWGTCRENACLIPSHCACGTTAQWGAYMTESGIHKASVPRKVARIALAAKRTHLSAEQILEVQLSDEPGIVLAERLGVSDSTISKARQGKHLIARQAGGVFAGLMR